MPAKPNERQYRALSTPLKPADESGEGKKRFDTEYYVEGYASTFNDPYCLFEDFDGTKYYEVVSPDAFRDADMTDVIMQYDHHGRVYARMSWAFTVAADEYDRETRTDTITRVKKVFDVSAVSIPADPNTEISARNMLNGAIERARGEFARRKRAIARARGYLAIMKKGE